MSIVNGFTKVKDRILTTSGFKLLSRWTSSQTVEFDDGKTAQDKLGSIDGITDSLTSDSASLALSAKSGKSLQDQITTLNSNLEKKVNGKVKIWEDEEGGNIRITSPNDVHYEFDACNDSALRMYAGTAENEVANSWAFSNSDGSFSAKTFKENGTSLVDKYIGKQTYATLYGVAMGVPDKTPTESGGYYTSYIYGSEDGNIGFRFKSNGKTVWLNITDIEAARAKVSATLKTTGLAYGSGEPTPDKSNLIIYNNTSSNWAGIGGSSNGDMVFRTGVGTTNKVIITNNGQLSNYRNGTYKGLCPWAQLSGTTLTLNL